MTDRDRRAHRVLRAIVALLACAATYAGLMAWLDTRRPARHPPVPPDADARPAPASP